ncbi:MAG: exonuclease domain-containing protein [Clostridia bacterium]
MNDVPFIEEINKKLHSEEQIFKLKCVKQIKPTKFSIVFLVNALKYDQLLNVHLKQKVNEITREILPPDVDYKIEYIKTITDSDYVKREVNKIIFEIAPTIYENVLESEIEVNINNETIDINIIAEQFLCDYFISSNLKNKVMEYLDTCFMEESIITLKPIPNKEEIIQQAIKHNENSAIRTIDIEIDKKFVGDIFNKPRYIVDILKNENPQLTVCGVVSNVNIREIPKLKKHLFSFTLNDTTSAIKVKCFAVNAHKKHKSYANKGGDDVDFYFDKEVFIDGNVLVISGNYKWDTFDNKSVLMANCIAKCTIAYNSIDIKNNFYTENEEYITIFPQDYQDTMQEDLFGISNVMCQDLLDKTYVVFDLETTGLDTTNDKIIEIGAVKVVKGRITETFECLINPECPIPIGASNVNHITDEMVEDCHTLEEILPDFYKFSRGAILVGHNAINFDIPMLTNHAFKLRYDFDNAYMDSMVLANKVFGKSRMSLAVLAKTLNVSLEGAHRAINDTVATAKIFVKLMNIIKAKKTQK